MPPRKRNPENAGLEPGLYVHPKGGFRYRDPRSGWEYWGKIDRAEAQRRARERNQMQPSKRRDAVSKVIADYLEHLEHETDNRASTLAVKRYILGFYARAFHSFSIRSMTRGVLMDHWKSIGPHGWAKHRNIWIDLYGWAISEGLCEVNEAELTRPPTSKALKRKRKRHTPEGYAKVYEHADDWLKIAMDLAITSLQDRSTLCAAKRGDIVFEKDQNTGLIVGRWTLTRSKTGANLAIRIRPKTRLEQAVRRALAFPVAGTYLVRRNPVRKSKRLEEFSQVTEDRLTKEFAAARDASGAYDDLPVAERPTFHQLRAYGSWLYKEAGYSKEYVQALLAHASTEMTAMYQADHAEPEIEYVDVEAEL